MAVLITTESIVKTINPTKRSFSIEELNDIVEGWVEPVKIGPLWIMYREGAEEDEPLNDIASLIFNVPLHGKVLVIPVQQLPAEWDLMEPDDYRFSGEEVDLGFLVSLQTALTITKMGVNPNPIYSPDGTVVFGMMPDRKEEWVYDPATPFTKEDNEENTKAFFRKVYSFVTKEKDKLKEKIIFEDTDVVVKVQNSKDLLKAIQQMIDMYVDEEEYEKCAKLQKIIEDFQVAG